MRSILFVLFLLFTSSLFSFAQQAETQIVNLKTEYLETPLGIDLKAPRFSWQMESVSSSRYQTAYQIIVKDELGQMVWNSGKVSSNISLNIKYSGGTLKPSTRYDWKVSVWDQDKKKHEAVSWFETGLMNPDPNSAAWSGAKWIGGSNGDLPFYSDYLPTFRLSFSLQLDRASKSTRAGFVYGANDSRLMDKNKNLYQLENPKDSSFICVELDIETLKSGKPALLHFYRAGFAPADKRNTPFKSFEVSSTLINEQNKYDKHVISLSSMLGRTEVYIDGDKKENFVGKTNLNPLGEGGDFIAFPVIGSIGFSAAKNQVAYFSDVNIRNYRSPSNTLFSAHSSPLKMEGKGEGNLILINPARNSAPMLRTTFSTVAASAVSKARLYVTSRGIYEVFLNGKRIGNDYFNPGLTQYNKTHLYQTYDVSRDIISGKNALGAILSEGWWSGGSTYMGEFWNFFGDRQSLLAKLVITYANGKEEVIVTDPSAWTYFNNGPIVYGSFFQGEVYDASKELLVKDWASASFDGSLWKKTVEIPLNGNISLDERNKAANMPMVDDYSRMALIGQCGDAVRKIKELTAISVAEVRPGVFVYDMGQNMAGVPKINLKGMEPRKKITLRFAEVKYPDLPEYKANVGMIMLENIRAAMAQDIYITRGGDETINPRFTYHGYRYLEITGIDKALPLDAVKGEVLSSIHQLASHYETSDLKVNKLWENITWSSYANFMSIPTDCPQRNERLGWSGDISVFSRTATYLANMPQFLRRHMLAMRDVQREDGRFTDVAPLGGGFGGVIWGSAGVTVAWESYQQYGDKELLAEHYDAMKRYIEFLIRSIDPKTNVLDEKDRDKWYGLGDWLSPEYNKTEKSLLWESYLIYDLEQLGKIAAVLNKKEDAEWLKKLYSERKAFFNKTYVDEQSGKTQFRGKSVDTQTSYVLPLAFNIIDENRRSLFQNNFRATVARENKADNGALCSPYSLMTGFIGTAWIAPALSDDGHSDMAYRLLQQTTYPSWLYSVEQGATTIWERLNSYTHTNGFGGNNRMNSFNHYSFGAVGAWMYDHSLGIQRDIDNPGFKHFILNPEPDPTGKMSYAKGFYYSMYGKIESSWNVKGNICSYHFKVPSNTTATLILNASSSKDVVKGNHLLNFKEVRYTGQRNGKYIFELPSGIYDFEVYNSKKVLEKLR